ncbi:MAG: hypothetical protein ACLRZF_09685 [Waltera sp.]
MIKKENLKQVLLALDFIKKLIRRNMLKNGLVLTVVLQWILKMKKLHIQKTKV